MSPTKASRWIYDSESFLRKTAAVCGMIAFHGSKLKGTTYMQILVVEDG